MTAAEEKELLETTIQAPTSFNIQHWRFVILRDPDLRAKIRKGTKDAWPKPGQLALDEVVIENGF